MTQEEIGEQELCVWLQLKQNGLTPAVATSSSASTSVVGAETATDHSGNTEKVRVLMKNMIKDEKRLQGIIKMIDADNSSKLSEAEFSKLAVKVLKKQKEVNASPGLLSAVWQEVRKHRKDMTQEEIGEQELCVWLQLNPNAAGSQKASKIIEEANNPNSHEADAEKIRALMKGLVKTEKRLLGIIKMIDADNSSKLSEAEFYKLCKKVLKKQKKINASPGLLSAVWQEVRKHCKDMTQEEIGEHELSVWLELK